MQTTSVRLVLELNIVGLRVEHQAYKVLAKQAMSVKMVPTPTGLTQVRQIFNPVQIFS